MVWYNYNGVLSKSKWRLFNQSGILSVSRDSYVWFYEYFYVFLLSYGWSKKRFSYLHSTVNGTFDIDFCSIIIIKFRRKNNISSPAGASQQERDKDHFSVFLLQIKSLQYFLSDYFLLYGLSLFGSVSSSMEHHPLFRDAGWETLAPLPLVDSSQRNYCQCSYRWPSQDGFIHHNSLIWSSTNAKSYMF